MNFPKLVDLFEKQSKLPIEIPEVMDAIKGLGVQDEIYCVPGDVDPGKLWGLMYRYQKAGATHEKFTKRDGVYGEPVRVSLVVYNRGLSLEWQRLVCCKELVHILDASVECPRSPDQVVELAEKLVGPLSTTDFGFADFVAAKDKMALYQALIILFPDAARAEAIEVRERGNVGEKELIAKIAKRTSLPLEMIPFVLEDGWPSLKKDLLDC